MRACHRHDSSPCPSCPTSPQATDLDAYLLAAGIQTPGLLPPAESMLASDDEEDVLGKIVGAVLSCVERAGSGLAFLGGWLRDRLASLFQPEGQSEEGSAAAGGSARRQSNAGYQKLVAPAMVAVVAVFCLLLVRRPLLLRRA